LAKYLILSKSCGDNWDISLVKKKKEKEKEREKKGREE